MDLFDYVREKNMDKEAPLASRTSDQRRWKKLSGRSIL